MNRTFIKILFLILLFPSFSIAATLHVTSGGTGDGSSYINSAPLTALTNGSGDFANLSGDTVCFYGAFAVSAQIKPGYTGDNYTLDGAADGSPCDDQTQATITLTSSDSNIFRWINDVDDLVIQGFILRNADNNGEARGISYDCPNGSTCSNIIIRDNDIQLYGGSGTNQTLGITLYGEMQDIIIEDNIVKGLNLFAYDGVAVRSQNDGIGDLKRILVRNNTVADWAHGNIMVSLIDTSAGGSLEYVYIYGNTLSAYNRHYGRGISIIGHSSYYGSHVMKYLYVYNNYMEDHRGPSQISGDYLAIFKNKTIDTRNVCPDPDLGGDSDCATVDVAYFPYDSCTDAPVNVPDNCQTDGTGCSDEWGLWDWMWAANGQHLVQNLDEQEDNAVFQNTYYGSDEASYSARNTGATSTNFNNVAVVGNIFSESYRKAIGEGWCKCGTSLPTGCPANPGGVLRGIYTDEPGDSNPPGSFISDADCTIHFISSSSSNMENIDIKKNIIYNEGLNDSTHELFCVGWSISGDHYTLAQAETAFSDEDELSISNNQRADPLFTDADNDDFTLSVGSPAIDVGFFTTITTADDTLATFNVANALFLGQPRITIAGEVIPGATVKTEDGETAELLSVTYNHDADDEVTLSVAVTFVTGDEIGLDYEGVSPDAGAEEYNPTASPERGDNIEGTTFH